MHWWDETEARIHRTPSAAELGLGLWQRLVQAGLDPDAAFLTAYDLAALQLLCADLVKLVDSLLQVADGDRLAWRRHALALLRWTHTAESWTRETAAATNRLLDSLDLDPSTLAAREEAGEDEPAGELSPEEEAKLEGRYRHWHLLYERLDLKLDSMGLEPAIRRGMARTLARLYEESVVTFRLLSGLSRDTQPRFGRVAKLLLQINTAWHFDLGPYVLGSGQARPDGGGTVGLATWLLLAARDPDVPTA